MNKGEQFILYNYYHSKTMMKIVLNSEISETVPSQIKAVWPTSPQLF